jgi:hypothetical protein
VFILFCQLWLAEKPGQPFYCFKVHKIGCGCRREARRPNLINPEDKVLMKIIGKAEVDTVTDVVCDVCQCSTGVPVGGFEYATLGAQWGFGSKHDGDKYELQICERCFFETVAYLKEQRRMHHMFDENEARHVPADRFGLVAQDVYFGDEV